LTLLTSYAPRLKANAKTILFRIADKIDESNPKRAAFKLLELLFSDAVKEKRATDFYGKRRLRLKEIATEEENYKEKPKAEEVAVSQ